MGTVSICGSQNSAGVVQDQILIALKDKSMYNFCNVCFNGFWCSFSLNYKKNEQTQEGLK